MQYSAKLSRMRRPRHLQGPIQNATDDHLALESILKESLREEAQAISPTANGDRAKMTFSRKDLKKVETNPESG